MSNPKKPTDMGQNRTAAALHPIETKKTTEGARESASAPSFDVSSIEAVRVAFSEVAEPVGTMPPPASIKGVAKTGMQLLKGNDPNVFLDLLGDRLAFERTGVRLYEALIAKLAASHQDGASGPTRADLELIRDDELRHMGLLTEAIERLGADPTVITPTADICSVASTGILKVLTDPRATFTHALHAIHIAELADNDAWLLLSDLAERLGQQEMATQFRLALADEERHLDDVRMWLTTSIDEQAGVEPRVEQPDANIPAP